MHWQLLTLSMAGKDGTERETSRTFCLQYINIFGIYSSLMQFMNIDC